LSKMSVRVKAAIARKREARRAAGLPDFWGQVPLLCQVPNGEAVWDWITNARDMRDPPMSWTTIAKALKLSRSMVRRIYWQGRDWLDMMPGEAPRKADTLEPGREVRTEPEPLPAEPFPFFTPERPQGAVCLRTIDCQWCEDKDDSCRKGCLLCPECPAMEDGRCRGGRRLTV
jgi:hypothetical protein